jgi:hypothetical protein
MLFILSEIINAIKEVRIEKHKAENKVQAADKPLNQAK